MDSARQGIAESSSTYSALASVFPSRAAAVKHLRLTEQQYASLKKRTVKLAAEIVVKPEQPDRYPLMLRDQIVEAGLPEPFREHVFHPTRGWKIDLAYPMQQKAIEIEGGVHRIKSRFLRDVEKYNEMTFMGWKLIRVTNEMVKNGEALKVVRRFIEAQR